MTDFASTVNITMPAATELNYSQKDIDTTYPVPISTTHAGRMPVAIFPRNMLFQNSNSLLTALICMKQLLYRYVQAENK